MSEFLIFVPVFNEENNLHLVFKELFNLKNLSNTNIMFFNSGSSDNSEKILKNSSFEYINLEKLGCWFCKFKSNSVCKI